MRQEKHFLEKKPTIPMEKHKGGDPNYKPKSNSPDAKHKTMGTPQSKPLAKPQIESLFFPLGKKGKGKPTNITKGDVLQTVLVPQVDLKKTIKVGEHYTKKAIKKGKEVIKDSSKYLNKGSGTIPKIYSKVKKYLKSDA